ncbi:aromatic ring-hydroxylating dioxygenase subunit alpha [Novosphingobium acidiphilum]|uniref:aromatic ring-hydroxylating dioxygenase subunit alpha n=1 Tax=Novosphingobium acidiphilum TaxID=505248 RepID=UPI00041FA977|nr:aromatic ring-hydroxylating dioxygenase subunit alpha [Novosphingobium acidiphilum]
MLRNAWYVAAWADEIDERPVEQQILGDAVVLWRKADGDPAAVSAFCSHRRLSLARGQVLGDRIACGYHGLQFAADGRCVTVPCQQGVPRGADIRGYPVAQRYGLVWIWMGDAALADPATIIHIAEWGSPAWGYNRGASMVYDCNYLLITDNLLDPSHVAWVHPTSFGGSSCEAVPMRIREAPSGYTVSRWIMDAPVTPFYRDLVPFAGHADRLQHYEVRYPSHAVIKAVFVPAGQGGDDAQTDWGKDAFLMDSYNFITPETESRSRYYWFQLRNVRPDDAHLSQAMSAAVLSAFSEDLAVLNEVQRGMDTCQDPHISIATDAGPLRYRHRLGQLIAAEQSA